jgi:hypothetical protein
METLTLQGVDTDAASKYTEKIFKGQCQIIDCKIPNEAPRPKGRAFWHIFVKLVLLKIFK